MDCSPPGSSVHGIIQVRILEWWPSPPPGYIPDPGVEPTASVSCIAGGFFTCFLLSFLMYCEVSSDIPFSLLMMVICIFSFLLCESGYRYISFIYLCQNKSLVSLFFSVVTVFHLIDFCSYLYDCLPSSFVFLFFTSLYRNLDCWFELFFYNTGWHELKCVPPIFIY